MKGITLAIVLLLGALACAVDSFDYHCANIALLQNTPDGLGKAIQQDIGLSQKQVDQMNDFAKVHAGRLETYKKSLAGKPPDVKVLLNYMEDLKKKVASVMTPAQIKRLREINLQAAGLLGLRDKVVAAKVGMSDTQHKKFEQTYLDGKKSVDNIVKAVLFPINDKYRKLTAPYKGKEQQHQAELKSLGEQYTAEARAAQEKIAPQVRSVTTETQKKLNALITSQQRATWTALQGRGFTPPRKS